MASTRSSTSPTFSPASLITQPGKSLSYCRGIGDPLTSTAAPPDPAPSPSAYRALAEGAGADGGRQRRAAHSGNAAGWGHQPAPCKSVLALWCVRTSLMLPAGEIPAPERGTSHPTGNLALGPRR